MTRDYYRIHRAGEALETLMDPARRDRWVASDEDYTSQPHGVSCCRDLDDLRSYISMYSMNVQPGDKLVLLRGTESYDRDRDQYAARCIVESYEVIGDAHDWLTASDETDEDEDEDDAEDE